MKNVLKNYNKIYDTFLDQTNNDLVMFRPIHINSSQLLCACQGTFKICFDQYKFKKHINIQHFYATFMYYISVNNYIHVLGIDKNI